MPSVCEFQLPEHEQNWLDSLELSHATNQDRNDAYALLNRADIGFPYKKGAVYGFYNDGSIPTAFVSGRALASEYDVVRFALVRKYISRGTVRKRPGA